MSGSVVVIGGAGLVGAGATHAFRDAGMRALVVDPAFAGGPDGFALDAGASGLAARIREAGPVATVVVSLPTRGEGRPVGDYRPAEVAARQWPVRLAALQLAADVLEQGGALIELAGSTALAPGEDEAGFVGGFQRGVHRGLASLGRIRSYLCAIHTRVRPDEDSPVGWPSAREIGVQLVALSGSDRPGGLCRIAAPRFELDWVEAD